MVQDYGFRLYNPSIGKFLSVDPLFRGYPELTPYQFASNTPIQAIDLDGLEMLLVNNTVRIEPMPSWLRDMRTAFGVPFHPIASMRVGSVERGGTNISSVSGRIARHVAERDNMSIGITTERNAFRHAQWSAAITIAFDAEIASVIGNLHEGIGLGASMAEVDENIPFVGDLMLADEIVDFMNNEIGREIGETLGEDASPIDIARQVLNIQRNNGLWVAQERDDGTISISRTGITQEQFENANDVLDTLDNNGMSQEDRDDLQETNN